MVQKYQNLPAVVETLPVEAVNTKAQEGEGAFSITSMAESQEVEVVVPRPTLEEVALDRGALLRLPRAPL